MVSPCSGTAAPGPRCHEDTPRRPRPARYILHQHRDRAARKRRGRPSSSSPAGLPNQQRPGPTSTSLAAVSSYMHHRIVEALRRSRWAPDACARSPAQPATATLVRSSRLAEKELEEPPGSTLAVRVLRPQVDRGRGCDSGVPVSLNLVRPQRPDLLRTRFSETGRTMLSH